MAATVAKTVAVLRNGRALAATLAAGGKRLLIMRAADANLLANDKIEITVSA